MMSSDTVGGRQEKCGCRASAVDQLGLSVRSSLLLLGACAAGLSADIETQLQIPVDAQGKARPETSIPPQ